MHACMRINCLLLNFPFQCSCFWNVIFYFQCIHHSILSHLFWFLRWCACAIKKIVQVFHYFFADDGINLLFKRVFWNVCGLKPLHNFRYPVLEWWRRRHWFLRNGGTQRMRLNEPVHQRLHAQLMHVRFHVDVIHVSVLHLRVHLVVQKAHLHIGRQLGAPQ